MIAEGEAFAGCEFPIGRQIEWPDSLYGVSRRLGLSRRLFLGLCGDCAEESQCGSIACRSRRAFGEKYGIGSWDRYAVLLGERGNFVRLIVRLMADVEFVTHGLLSNGFQN